MDAFYASSSFTLGIGLPSADVGTDINLSIYLFLNVHFRWAFWVMVPVFMNTFFTIIACVRIEKKNTACYLPLVVFQLYPQYCIARLLYRWASKELGLAEFLDLKDKLDGGLGCLEPYIESVPQVYIQTAFFLTANSLTTKVTHLCYNEKARSCAEFDIYHDLDKCSTLGHDYNHCNPIGHEPYPSKSDIIIQDCLNRTENCTKYLNECTQPLLNCLSKCQNVLTEKLSNISQAELSSNITQTESSNNTTSFLFTEYGASLEDVQSFQLYFLFIGSKTTFLTTYIISILAAAYGVTKFFRLGKAAFIHNLMDFGVTWIITCTYIVGNGVALGVFLRIAENEMYINVLWWGLFCILPSYLLALIVIVGQIFRKRRHTMFNGSTCSVYHNYSLRLLSEEPPIVIAPIITPFIFEAKLKRTFTRYVDEVGSWKSKVKFQVSYFLSRRFTLLNNIVKICCVGTGIILKGNLALEIAIPITATFLAFTTAFLHRYETIYERQNQITNPTASDYWDNDSKIWDIIPNYRTRRC